MTDPFLLRNFKPTGLQLLGQIAGRQAVAAKFWIALHDACERESFERQKIDAERQAVSFEIPDLGREEIGIIRNEIAYLVSKLETSDDHGLVCFLAAVGIALGAQLEAAAERN